MDWCLGIMIVFILILVFSASSRAIPGKLNFAHDNTLSSNQCSLEFTYLDQYNNRTMSLDEFDDGSYYDKDYFITRPFDERKPRVPYVKGFHFTVQQHIPPPPVKLDPITRCTITDIKASEKMEQLHPVERCRQYPPLPGSYGPLHLELEIHDTIRIGDHHRAQVVVVEVLSADFDFPVKGLSQGQRVVAKLYDPMYIDDDDFYVNPFLVADKAYTHETATYEALAEYQGAAIPDYYGSYSLDIPIGTPGCMRTVRLILIEFIPGLSMQKIDPGILTHEARQSVMKSIIEFETSVHAKDILLTDLTPRNVMVTDLDPDSVSSEDRRRLVFIDFGDAEVGCGAVSEQKESGAFEFHIDHYYYYYVPPLLRWHYDQHRNDPFVDWIDWYWQPWLQTEFADTAVAITPGMLEYYMPYYFRQEVGDDMAEGLRRVVGC